MLFRPLLLTSALLAIAATPAFCQTPTPTPGPGEVWKTAFYKRGNVGTQNTAGYSGANATMRVRTPIHFNGSQARVYLGSAFEVPVTASKITLARGLNGLAGGYIEGTPIQMFFAGSPSITIPARGSNVGSSPAVGNIQKGIWYLQQSYSSERFLYAYAADGFRHQAGDQHSNPARLTSNVGGGMWPGNVYRIDVLTEDTRPTVLCYGDSITQGYGSTPETGRAYPEVLNTLINRPTLNLGVNNDTIAQAATAPSTAKSCKGVDTVVLLIGINDIYQGTVKTLSEYTSRANPIISGIKTNGQKVYLGTLMPSGGVPAWDSKPARETLRQSINTWIRNNTNVTGVIDFDAALRDPAIPSKLQVGYQSDWIHPNDAGYQKMAETAAAVLQPTP